MNNVIFYHNTSSPNTVSKTLTQTISLACEFLDDESILNPRIKVRYNNSVLTSNYCYIPKFDRYYYITDIVTSKGYMFATLKVDVLETYKTQIKNLKAVIKRQQYKYNTYLQDDRLPAYAYEILSAYAFGTPFTKDSIAYLTLLGGAEVNSAPTQ